MHMHINPCAVARVQPDVVTVCEMRGLCVYAHALGNLRLGNPPDYDLTSDGSYLYASWPQQSNFQLSRDVSHPTMMRAVKAMRAVEAMKMP